VGIGAKSPHQKHKYFFKIFREPKIQTPQVPFMLVVMLDPIDQYWSDLDQIPDP
jgi:hypothetical protein